MEQRYLHQQFKLSKNADKHIQKYHKEFEFDEPKQFKHDAILSIAKQFVVESERMFIHQHRNGNSLIFLRDDIILIVDAKRLSIKTMFKISNIDYIGMKLKRKFWVEIQKN